MRRGILAALFVAAPLVVCGLAQDEVGFESEVRAAEVEYLGALEELGDWCTSKKLFAERDAVYEHILLLEPEHAKARKFLKHRRERDGSWTVPEKKRAAKNVGSAELLEECSQRRADVNEAFAERLFGVVGFYERLGAEGGLTSTRKGEVYQRILIADRDHAGVHAFRGEEKLEERWVLAETVRAKPRRAELKAIVREALEAVPALENIALNPVEKAMGLSFTAAVGTPRVRVLGTVSRDELERAARVAHATFEVYAKVFDDPVRQLEDYTIYLVSGDVDRDAFIRGWPGWGPDRLAEVRVWAGAGVPEDIHLARWDRSAEQRLDGAMRHTLGLCMKLDTDVGLDAAWAWEGFGMYLSRLVVGTRLTWYGSGQSTATAESQSKELLGRLLNSDVNWMNEAYQMLRAGGAPRLGTLLGRRIDSMGVRDVLMAYAFAAYLLEGCGDAAPAILASVGEGEQSSADAVRAVLERDLGETRDRLQRWLSERR
jgi:hypothetical protein